MSLDSIWLGNPPFFLGYKRIDDENGAYKIAHARSVWLILKRVRVVLTLGVASSTHTDRKSVV